SIVCVSYRPNERCDGTKFRGRLSADCTVAHGFAVRHEGESSGSFLFIERFVKQDDPAGDVITTELAEFFEAINHHDISSEAFRSGGSASPERSKHDLLCGFGRPAGILDELRRLYATDPMRNLYFLKLDLQTKAAQLVGYIVDRRLGLQRSTGARTNVFR